MSRARISLKLALQTGYPRLLLVGALLAASCGRVGAPESLAPATITPSAVATSIPATMATQPVTTQVTATQASITPAPVPAASIDFAPLVAVIKQEMAAQQVPGLAVAVIHQGALVFSQGFGVADVATNRAVTPATPFRIGSITKPLTTIGLLQLVEAGEVDLDRPVATYVPEFGVNDQITVRQLLSHSSGLGDAAIPYGRTDAGALRDYVASLTHASAFAPPGEIFSYSNTGFNVVGRIIEAVSGMAYTEYMSGRVLPALGMTHTTFDRTTAQAEGLALGYYPGRGAPTPVDRDPDNGAEYPSGFAFSTLEDLTRLSQFLLNDGLVDGAQTLLPATVQAMKQAEVMVEPLGVGYGLGLLLRTADGRSTIGHNGTINGYAATLEIVPSEQMAVIVLSNRNNYDPARITAAAFELLLGPPTVSPSIPTIQTPVLDEAALAEYTGRYLFSNALIEQETEALTVAVQDGQLTASLPGITFQLRAAGTDLFDVYVPEMAEPLNQLAFVRDATGAIQYMHFTLHALVRQAE